MIIAISGVPATGKSTLAKKISRLFGMPIIVVADLVEAKKIKGVYDKSAKTYDVHPRDVDAYIAKHNMKHAIIESVFSHVLKSDLVIVTTCDLTVLSKRLFKRKYAASKIRDNLDAQIFDVCYVEALEFGKKPIKVDCTKPMSLGAVKKIFGKKIKV